jgi:RNA polymerase sigma factor (sigma-70 family)
VEFVDGRFTALRRFGYLLCGDWHLAEDPVQASLAKVWFQRNGLRSGNALESYIRTVMVNTQTQWWRRKWKGETPSDELPEHAAMPEYSAVDERDLLFRALSTLPRRTRATIVLRYFEDLPYARDRTDHGVLDRHREGQHLPRTGQAPRTEPVDEYQHIDHRGWPAMTDELRARFE